MTTSEAPWAYALVPIYQVLAGAPMLTLPMAVVDFQLAGSPHPLLRADALEAVHLIHAGATRRTRIRGTLIDVKRTGGSTPS